MAKKNLSEKKNIFFINYKLFLTLLLLTPLYLFKNIYIKLLGGTAIVFVILLASFDIVNRMDRIKVNKIWLWFIIFCFYNIILLIRTPTFKALYIFLLQVSLLLLVFLLTT